MSGNLFIELIEDLSKNWKNCFLLTGEYSNYISDQHRFFKIERGPIYNRKNVICRLISWVKFIIISAKYLFEHKGRYTCLIVSNPPFLGIVGLLTKILKNNRYIILIYDIHPDILINIGKIKKTKLTTLWDKLNKLIYERADLIVTISYDMAMRLENKFKSKKIPVIYPWADMTKIKPIPKSLNWFAEEHKLKGKTVVLYSGNMGFTHNIEPIVNAADKLKNEQNIIFLFIGDGPKRKIVEDSINIKKLRNICLLPYQSYSTLPFSMAAGDIGIVSYTKGSEGCMLPSKACYYFAAGLPAIILSSKKTDLTEIVQKYECGIWVKDGNDAQLVNVILELHKNKILLNELKLSARKVAENKFSRNNTKCFTEIIEFYC